MALPCGPFNKVVFWPLTNLSPATYRGAFSRICGRQVPAPVGQPHECCALDPHTRPRRGRCNSHPDPAYCGEAHTPQCYSHVVCQCLTSTGCWIKWDSTAAHVHCFRLSAQSLIHLVTSRTQTTCCQMPEGSSLRLEIGTESGPCAWGHS